MCPGRCVQQDSTSRCTTAHNHPPEPDRLLVDKFRKVLTQRAAAEPTTELYTIYWEEASQRHSEAALLYTFPAAESAMRKARRKQLPQPPKNIGDLADVVINSKHFRVQSGGSRDQFYQTTLTLNDSACVLFIHMQTLAAVGRIEELQLNMTLETPATATTIAYQLLCVHAIHAHQVSQITRRKVKFIISHIEYLYFILFCIAEYSDCVCAVDSAYRIMLLGHIHVYS